MRHSGSRTQIYSSLEKKYFNSKQNAVNIDIDGYKYTLFNLDRDMYASMYFVKGDPLPKEKSVHDMKHPVLSIEDNPEIQTLSGCPEKLSSIELSYLASLKDTGSLKFVAHSFCANNCPMLKDFLKITAGSLEVIMPESINDFSDILLSTKSKNILLQNLNLKKINLNGLLANKIHLADCIVDEINAQGYSKTLTISYDSLNNHPRETTCIPERGSVVHRISMTARIKSSFRAGTS